MKEKDFKSLSVDEQEEKIRELITSWYKQDLNNRCAIVILGDRKDKKDLGKSLCYIAGPGALIAASLETAFNHDENFKNLATYCLMESLRELLSMLDKSKEKKEWS